MSLQLVSTAARSPAPRVFNVDAIDRLARLNDAVRAIRRMGIRIIEQTPCGEFPAEGEPCIRIARDPDQSIAALLDAAGPRTWVVIGRAGQTSRAACAFRGVTVIIEMEDSQ